MSELHPPPSASRAQEVLDTLWHGAKITLSTLASAAICGVGGAVVLNNFGQTPEPVGSTKVEVGPRFDFSGDNNPFNGGSTVGIPNTDVREDFDTHSVGPSLVARYEESSLSGILNDVGSVLSIPAAGGEFGASKSSSQPAEDRYRADIRHIIQDEKWHITSRALGSFLVGALLTSVVLTVARNRKELSLDNFRHREEWVGACLATLLAAGSAGIGIATLDESAFAEPQVHGMLAEVGDFSTMLERLDDLDERSAKTAKGILTLFSAIQAEAEAQEGLPEEGFNVIFVSDIHGRNVNSLIQQAVESYGAVAVVDIGDRVDWGSTYENDTISNPGNAPFRRVSMSVGDITVNYLFAPGNHELPSTVEALAAFKNVTVVEKGEIAEWNIHGLRVLATGDPLYAPDGSYREGDVLTDAEVALREKIQAELDAAIAEGKPYDFIVAHEQALLEGLNNLPEGVVFGHDHKPKLEFDRGYDQFDWLLDPGTLGGAGARTYQENPDNPEKPTPQTMYILRFDEACNPFLAYKFTQTNIGGTEEITLERETNPLYEQSSGARCKN